MKSFTKWAVMGLFCVSFTGLLTGCLIEFSTQGIRIATVKDKQKFTSNKNITTLVEIRYEKMISMVVDTTRALFEVVSNPLGAVADWLIADLFGLGKAKANSNSDP